MRISVLPLLMAWLLASVPSFGIGRFGGPAVKPAPMAVSYGGGTPAPKWGVVLVVNTASKKYHLPECPWAGQLSDKNASPINGTSEALAIRYAKSLKLSACEHCFPKRDKIR